MPDTIEAPTILVEKKGRITLWQVGEFSRDDYILSELQTFAQEETAQFNLSRGVDGAVTLESVEMQEDSSLAVVKYQFDGWESCTRFCGEVFFFGTVKEAVRQGFSAGVALTGVKDGAQVPESQLAQWTDRSLVVTDMKANIYCSGTVTHVSSGAVLNKARGREMVTSYILGFFMNGVYQLAVLYGFGSVVPILNPELVLSRGYGIRNVTNLDGIRNTLDNAIPLEFMGIHIPLATFLVIGVFCLFIVWFRRTKLGQDMRATGQDLGVAHAAGIPVMRTRIISIVISTVLAAYGQIIFLQNVGTLNTYNSHEQAGVFAIASLLVGGATVARASILNVFTGVLLFHLMFVVSPMAGKYLVGDAQIGEYFRVFVCYAIISLALVLHAWRRHADKVRARADLRGDSGGAA